MSRARLNQLAAPHGLVCRGVAPDGGRWIYLLGPDLPRFWDIFATSAEFADASGDALDRWSQRVIGALAEALTGTALFPFGGPPYEPFLRWATASGEAWASPVGPLVHGDAGLFISYRGAIALTEPPDTTPRSTPCPSCSQPCLTACPVGALGKNGYDVAACRAHVSSQEGVACREGGCLVRHACPVGAAPVPAQAAYHMEAFLGP